MLWTWEQDKAGQAGRWTREQQAVRGQVSAESIFPAVSVARLSVARPWPGPGSAGHVRQRPRPRWRAQGLVPSLGPWRCIEHMKHEP